MLIRRTHTRRRQELETDLETETATETELELGKDQERNVWAMMMRMMRLAWIECGVSGAGQRN